jgi:tryptophan 2,3-dioxygenase
MRQILHYARRSVQNDTWPQLLHVRAMRPKNYAQTRATQSQAMGFRSRFFRALQVGIEPGAGVRPTSERRGAGDAEYFAGIVNCHAAE